MSNIIARDIQGKSIVSTSGTTIGTLHNITMDAESGVLCDLIVDQPKQISSMVADENDDNHLRIPVSMVETVGDHIIVDTK